VGYMENIPSLRHLSNDMLKSICIIGDISVDIVTDMSSVTDVCLEQLVSTKHTATHIDWMPGGTGLAMAVAARESGIEDVRLIGSLGSDGNDSEPDCAGRYLTLSLIDRGIHLYTSLHRGYQTGTVIIIYLANDQRLMVADPGANSAFTLNSINEDMTSAIRSTDILFVSGYAMLKPERAAAVKEMMELAYAQQKLVVLDVVPHNLYKQIDSSEFISILENVHLVVAEIETIKRFLFSDYSIEKSSKLSNVSVWKRVAEHCPAALLRPDNETQILFDVSGQETMMETDYAKLPVLNRRGASELLTMNLLLKEYERLYSYI